MSAIAGPRVLLCADEPEAVADVRQVLEQAGQSVAWQMLEPFDAQRVEAYDLVVVDGSRRAREAWQVCRHVRGQLAEGFIPILFLTSDQDPAARLASLQSGADTYLL